MKALSVTTILPDADAQWWRIINIADQLRLLGVEVDIVHYIIKGFESHRILSSKDGLANENSITIGSAIVIPFVHLKKLCSQKYSFVYGNTYAGTFFSIFGRLLGIPLVLDMHGISEEFLTMEKKPNQFKLYSIRFMEFMSLRFSNKIICVSSNMIDHLHNKKGVPLDKLIFGTNGVDLDFFKPQDLELSNEIRRNLNIEDKFIFGYIGGFQGYQGVEYFIEAARKINNKKIYFLVVGAEKYSKEDNIIFLPKVPRKQVPLYYSACDVLVLPRPPHIATEVAAPTKFAEYCAMGKPILTTDVGDAADLVQKYRNGIIIKDNSPENLKKGFLEFLNLDCETLIEMSKNSRNLAESEFDWKKVSSNILTELKKITK